MDRRLRCRTGRLFRSSRKLIRLDSKRDDNKLGKDREEEICVRTSPRESCRDEVSFSPASSSSSSSSSLRRKQRNQSVGVLTLPRRTDNDSPTKQPNEGDDDAAAQRRRRRRSPTTQTTKQPNKTDDAAQRRSPTKQWVAGRFRSTLNQTTNPK